MAEKFPTSGLRASSHKKMSHESREARAIFRREVGSVFYQSRAYIERSIPVTEQKGMVIFNGNDYGGHDI